MMIWFTVFSVFIFHLIKCQDTKLLLTQILFRHGDRAPIQLYANDPNSITVWPEGLGKLTLLGKKQQYANGKVLRSMYKDFITSSPNEVFVISSEVDRCIRSAQANLASFFAPSPEWSFDNKFDWQPIPVHYTSYEKDKYLFPLSYCPNADAEYQKIEESPENQKLLSDHKEMIFKLSFYSGSIINNSASIIALQDTLLVEKIHNLIIPPWVEPLWDELVKFTDLSFHMSFKSPLIQRLRAGPFLQKIIENINKKLWGVSPDLKVHVFSAHDYNIVAVLEALNVYNMRRPPYCATLLFELHEKMDGQRSVRLLYLNSTTPEDGFQAPHVLILEGCFEFCPLDSFIDYTRHLIPEDWEKECEASGDTFLAESTGTA